MNTRLENYEPGRAENKPEVLTQIKQAEDDRNRRLQEHQTMLQLNKQFATTNVDIVALRNEYEQKLSDKHLLVAQLLKRVKELTNEIAELKAVNAKTNIM